MHQFNLLSHCIIIKQTITVCGLTKHMGTHITPHHSPIEQCFSLSKSFCRLLNLSDGLLMRVSDLDMTVQKSCKHVFQAFSAKKQAKVSGSTVGLILSRG